MVDWYSQIRYTVPKHQELDDHNQLREHSHVDSPVLTNTVLELNCSILCAVSAGLLIAGEEGVLETLI